MVPMWSQIQFNLSRLGQILSHQSDTTSDTNLIPSLRSITIFLCKNANCCALSYISKYKNPHLTQIWSHIWHQFDPTSDTNLNPSLRSISILDQHPAPIESHVWHKFDPTCVLNYVPKYYNDTRKFQGIVY